ncbi:dihydrofolate reductase [Lentzea tibetensis]|uniref:Dihydrofolate reductase n=1 Tax=Lentzea tibetensis TaxID=2591470 RepID=A0A563EKW1_9PSEU|nr:dihydrofolate reductase family protein [Lentzea tibetensis]TWP47516.1 dihydrofolate reductase [Lentzea tibetensis]
MRKLILSISISLDGFIEGPNREIDWHMVNDEYHEYINNVLRAMSMFHQGRVTHELMAAYWPTADQDPEAGRWTKDFAGIWRDMPKHVYSKTLDDTADWNTTVKREVDPDEINELKRQPGGDMVVGGADLASAFRDLDLIDEYHLYVTPVLIGAGNPLFKHGSLQQLTLAETRTFSNGVVLLRYTR